MPSPRFPAAQPMHETSAAGALFLGGVLLSLGLLVVPVPNAILDVLLALNLSFAVVILVTVLTATRTLALSSFPSMLLVATCVRLALNVSTTRSILSDSGAGQVIEGFRRVVLGGDLPVGFAIFLVVTIVQFLVIAKGAERISEVSARFTLDALPGKQISIDGAVRSGMIDEAEAERRRQVLGQESRFFGSMDGAMKFVKGDAVLGIVIVFVNLLAGTCMGVFRRGLPFGEAIEVYAGWTVGDGMVSQIPALMLSLAAGFIATRVEDEGRPRAIGPVVFEELVGPGHGTTYGAAFAGVLALMPGLPSLPFLLVAGGLAGLSLRVAGRRTLERRAERARAEEVNATRSTLAQPGVHPVTLELGRGLSRCIELANADQGLRGLLEVLIPDLRDALFQDTGVPFPPIHVRARVAKLPEDGFRVLVRDVPVREGHVPEGHVLTLAEPARLHSYGILGQETRHPLSNARASWVPSMASGNLEEMGISVWSPVQVLVLHLASVLRSRAAEFLGLEETSRRLAQLEETCPALIREVVPKQITVQQLADVLRRLVDEGVSVRDLKTIVEALGQVGDQEIDGVALTECVRAALSPQIAFRYAGLSGRLSALTVSPMVEDTLRDAIVRSPRGSYLALEPSLRRLLVEAVDQARKSGRAFDQPTILLTSADVRRYLHKVLREALPGVTVLSFQELPLELVVQSLGQVNWETVELSPNN
jgi:type III secretion protein V